MSSRFYIEETTVHAAFSWLQENIGPTAAARAMRERREDEKKAAKARAFLRNEGSVAERENKALIDEGYQQACEALYEAIEEDERCRGERSKCEQIIEAWRSSQANFRAMGKIG